MSARITRSAGVYRGPALSGAGRTGEQLATGRIVRIVGQLETLAAGPRLLVDLPSDAYGTGRTYTVWNVPAATVQLLPGRAR